MNWWGSIKKSLPEAVRQLPGTYFYKSTGPGTIAGNHEWEQIVELASGRLGAEVEGACEGQRAELEGGEAVLNVDDSKPLVEGWLAKQTILHSTTNRTPWRNRYFILKRGCIHYYDVIAEDAIHLKDFAVEHESSRLPIKLEGTEKFGYLLTLVFDQPIEGREAAGVKDDMANRMLYLAAESEEEKNNWLDWFVNVALGSESEQRKGWLMVRDKRTRAWKNRYFTLKGKTLHQHHRDQKGIFPLAGAEVWSRDGFSFSVKAKSGKILNLMADGQDVRDKWLQLILRVIKHYQANELHQTILEKEDYDMLDFTHKVKDWVDTERARVEKRVQDFLASGASCPPTSSPDGKFRILSIDGGGMRGLMNCILLSRLLMVFPDLFEKVNFWVGTSNGGMLAMAFAFGYSPALCRTLLELAGTKVFIKREGYTGVLNRAKFSSQALKILCDEVYGKLTLAQCPSFVLLPSLLLDNHAPDALQRACENRYYHNLPKRKDDRERRRRAVSFNTLRQRQQREQERRKREREAASQQAAPPPSEARPPSPALAYKASSDSGRDEDHHHHQHHHHQQQEGPPSSPFFEIGSSPVDTSRPRPPPAASFGGGPEHGEGEGEGEGDPRVNEMLSETASDLVMRTIAAPTYFPSHQQHVDGGMFAHDPASSALTLAISPYWLNKKLDEVVLLSFGTGKVNHYYEDDSHDWGYMQWVPKLAGVLWDGMIMQSEQMCHELLGDRYFRFNPVLQTEIPLDNPEAVPLLVDIALNIELGPLVAWINENFYSAAAAAAAKADRGATSASDATSEEASPPAEGARGRVGSAAAQGRRVAFAASSSSSSSSKAKGESYDASAEGDDHDTDTDTDVEGEGEGEGGEGERRRRRRSRMRQDQEGQVKREREAIEVWERREQEEQERRERIERMEREKRERERRDREERERREQAERERVEREEREEREREQQRREAREREARERGDKEARERQEAQEREAREEEERRQREVQEREERERREREELEAIERRAQQMREIEEIERKAREERERLDRARREEEEEAERERLLREAEAEEERRQTQEREELLRRREEEEARLAREAEERREREEKLLIEREAEEREARRRQEEVKKADKQTRPVGGGGGGMNFFEQEFTFEEAVLLAEEGAPLPPPGQQQQPPPLPHRRAGPPHSLAAPVVVNSPVDDLFAFLTTSAGMGGGKNQDSSAGTTATTTTAVLDTPANGGKKQPANLDDFFSW